ncbi:MAG: DNA recombination protein RmuC [Phycisphaerae bacterium]
MWEPLWGVGGLIVGGIAAWAVATSRAKLAAHREREALATNVAATDSSLNETRRQLADAVEQNHALRDRLDAERDACVKLRTELAERNKRFEEQARLLAEAENKLKDVFESLSAKALQSNAEQFLSAARKTLELMLKDARGDLGKREEAVRGLVKPIEEALKRHEQYVKTIERERKEAYGSLTEQVKTLTAESRLLQQETGKLATSLRDPKVRGRWGEFALRRTAELAGMIDHCDFEEQVHVAGDDARSRPDMVVHLPGGRTVIVDAKAVLDAYLDAVGADTEDARKTHLARHAAHIRERVRDLSGRTYWDKLGDTPEFVVLFLPGESFFSAALDVDRKLIEDAMDHRVVLASPTTLIALLRAVAYGWRQQHMADNAEKISRLGAAVFDRVRAFVTHLDKMGTRLSGAVDAYNGAVGSLEHRVLPSVRRFRELGAAGGDDLPELDAIDIAPRHPDRPEDDGAA